MSYEVQQREHETKEAQLHKQQQERMAQVMQRFATLVVGRPIGVKLSDNTHAPAWSTANTIQFSQPLLPAPLATAEGIMVSRGLTWHELSHILFTPRNLTDIVQWVLNNAHHRAFNILEDQRIEMLTVAKYQAVTPWLIQTMSRYILNDNVEQAFPLVYGRKYLPQSVREDVARAYYKPQEIAELISIIDEYLTLTFPSDTERAKELIERFSALMPADIPEGGCTGGAGGTQSGGKKSRPVPEKKQKELQKDMPQDEDFDWSEPTPESGDESEGGTCPVCKSGQQATNAMQVNDCPVCNGTEPGDEPTQTPDGQPTDGTPSDSSDSDADGEDGSGSGVSPAGQQAIESMQDAVRKAQETVAEQVKEDILKVKGELSMDGSEVPRPASAPNQSQFMPTAESVRASVRFKNELQRIKAEHDPAWDYKTRKGRLNAKRYSLGARIDEVFDKFEQGRSDTTDIEAVILLDTSSSMNQMRKTAYESMWGIKRALDGVDASTTVLTFDNTSHVLYDSNERATSVSKYSTTSGMTNPRQGLRYAQSILANSDRAIKMLYVITDGAWRGWSTDSEMTEDDELIHRMTQAGVMTTLAYIDEFNGGVDSIDSHQCSTVARVTEPADLLQVGRAVVKQAIARNLVA